MIKSLYLMRGVVGEPLGSAQRKPIRIFHKQVKKAADASLEGRKVPIHDLGSGGKEAVQSRAFLAWKRAKQPDCPEDVRKAILNDPDRQRLFKEFEKKYGN